jgi:hypothetical protein
MVEKQIGPSPILKDKSISRENLEKGVRAKTGGDPYDRSRSKYSKASPQKDHDPSEEL